MMAVSKWMLYTLVVCALFFFGTIEGKKNSNSKKKNIKQVKSILNSQLRDYLIIKPYRSTSEGKYISKLLNAEFKRGKHEYKKVTGKLKKRKPRDVEDFEQFHFNLNSTRHEEELVLNVTGNDRLVVPGTKVNIFREDGTSSSKLVRRKCHFNGNVPGDQHSRVSISICNGMMGWIYMDKQHHLIEPLDVDGHEEDQYHVFYKKSDIKESAQADQDGITLGVNLQDDMIGPVEAFLDNNNRRKRAISYDQQYSIETYVVGDNTVIEMYGGEGAEQYYLTMMDIVHESFQHDSLRADIHVVVSRMTFLNKKQSDQLIDDDNPNISRRQICEWFSKQHVDDDADPDHFDALVFLTRRSMDKAGIALVSGMCKKKQNCVVVRDQGLPSAYIVAHELSHLLGVGHDTEKNNCSEAAETGSIMAPLVISNYDVHFWSNCTNNQLADNMDKYPCLVDDPFKGDFFEPVENPGSLYTFEDQCRFIHDERFGACPWAIPSYGIDPCFTLMCSDPENATLCAHDHANSPALDGTSCADDAWCQGGQCTFMNQINGGWTDWSPWTQCSYPCGGGVTSRTRECSNPRPENGGRYCEGEMDEFKVCNKEKCKGKAEDMRALYCESYGNEITKGDWKPHQLEDEDRLCMVTCENRDTNEVKTFDFFISDGVSCSYENPYGICVQGYCRTIGCDKEFDSNMMADDCGVCGGDNSQCQYPEETYIETLDTERKLIARVPAEAHNIIITRPFDELYDIVISEARTGKIILQTKGIGEDTSQVVEAHTRFVITTNEAQQQQITANGPMNTDIEVSLTPIDVRKNPGADVTYSYSVHKDYLVNSVIATTEAPETYTWTGMGWSKCSKSCGGGFTYYRYQCIRDSDRKKVEKSHCNQKNFNQNDYRASCNSRRCPLPEFDWTIGTWGECSKTCGSHGIQLRKVTCMKSFMGRTTKTKKSLCRGRRPAKKQSCTGLSRCAAKWETTEWSDCSVTCGRGSRTRDVYCKLPAKYPNSYICRENRPLQYQECSPGDCMSKEEEDEMRRKEAIRKQGCKPLSRGPCEPSMYQTFCTLPGYEQICCTTCDAQRRLVQNELAGRG
ncbi:A disintegrin and metalloproteinase with thrombospondin motifs 3-like [Antedon mediterranea]|uniref:A disintegrin and metalloproteinase with thrombospondin motifs 3-like n=1 Tax=Antedon mediterranea TaxID=105859 RepID=UPI003AF4FF5B